MSDRRRCTDAGWHNRHGERRRTADTGVDSTTTAVVFALIVAVGAGGLAASGMMATDTVLMMVLPSMLVFGLGCLGIVAKHGEYRTGGR